MVKQGYHNHGFGSARSAALALAALCPVMGAAAQDSAADIAKKLNNPIAALISVPFQLNYDQDIGPGDKGERYLMNLQPVIPMSLSEDWNLISRTILPLIDLKDVPPGNDESGLGDTTQSFFFSPKALTAGGWTWGAGPVILAPTATDDVLGTEKWGAGPTAVALRQANGWTIGALVNHVWSFAGDGDRSDVDSTFMQPFIAFTTSKHATFALNTESTYDWEADKWSVPINAMFTQVFHLGGQAMSLQAGIRYWADAPDSGAEGWGARLTYTLVFPK
jgi:hypothetical protein